MTWTLGLILIAAALLGISVYIWSRARAGGGGGDMADGGRASTADIAIIERELLAYARAHRGPLIGIEVGLWMRHGKTVFNARQLTYGTILVTAAQTARESRREAAARALAGAELAVESGAFYEREQEQWATAIATGGGWTRDDRGEGWVVTSNSLGGHDWYQGATGWAGGRPPAGRAVYPVGVHGAELVPSAEHPATDRISYATHDYVQGSGVGTVVHIGATAPSGGVVIR